MRTNLKSYLGRRVKVIINHQLGTHDIQEHNIWYPVNYGHIADAREDGVKPEVYLLGIYEPVSEASGIVIGLVLRIDGNEDKLVVAPEGRSYTVEQVQAMVAFQERFFTSRVVVSDNFEDNLTKKSHFKLLAAVHLFLIRDGQILLSRRFNTGYEDGKYSVIAGHLDGNEEVKAATIREAQEEASIQIAPEDLEIVGVMHRRSNHEFVDFFLLATRWSGEIVNTEPHKCDELTWFGLDFLPINILPYVRKALEIYRQGQQGIWFASLGWNYQN